METKDHLALGKYLLDKSGDGELYRHRRAFLWGCIEPDCNVLTYLRGARKQKSINGHSAENAETIISSCLRRLEVSGLRSSCDYFLLGIMLHYSADAFTYPHNLFSQMCLAEHIAYERQLHFKLGEVLGRSLEQQVQKRTANSVRYYSEMREAYCCSEHTPEGDSMFILAVCGSLLAGCLQNCRAVMPRKYSAQGVFR